MTLSIHQKRIDLLKMHKNSKINLNKFQMFILMYGNQNIMIEKFVFLIVNGRGFPKSVIKIKVFTL